MPDLVVGIEEILAAEDQLLLPGRGSAVEEAKNLHGLGHQSFALVLDCVFDFNATKDSEYVFTFLRYHALHRPFR